MQQAEHVLKCSHPYLCEQGGLCSKGDRGPAWHQGCNPLALTREGILDRPSGQCDLRVLEVQEGKKAESEDVTLEKGTRGSVGTGEMEEGTRDKQGNLEKAGSFSPGTSGTAPPT